MESIEKLSDNELLKVFEYLDVPDIFKLRACCKQWNRVALNDSLYRNIRLEDNINVGFLSNVIRLKAPAFKSVKANFDILIRNQAAFAEFVTFCRPESLSLHVSSREPTEEDMISILGSFELKTLQVILNSGSLRLPVNEMLQLLRRPCQRLECSVVSTSAVRLNELRVNELILGGRPITYEDMPAFFQLNENNLTKLTITGGVECYPNKLIFVPLSRCRNLKSLTFGNKILENATDDGWMMLSNLKLESITVNGAKFSSSCWFEFFQNMTTLKKISLFRTVVEGFAVRQIAINCKDLVKFAFVDWSAKTRFEDLLYVANNCPKLKVLRILYPELLDIRMLARLEDLDELRYVHCFNESQVPYFWNLRELYPHHELKWKTKIDCCSGLLLEFASFKKNLHGNIIRKRGLKEFLSGYRIAKMLSISSGDLTFEFIWKAVENE